MRKHLFFWELAGFVFTGAAGTLLHFVYEWSGGSVLAAAFSAVNESTWEHMKLLFFPLFLFSMVQFCLMGRNYPNLPAVRAVSTLTGLALIPVLPYLLLIARTAAGLFVIVRVYKMLYWTSYSSDGRNG